MVERVRAGVIDVRMNDRGGCQRVTRRMSDPVGYRGAAAGRQGGPRGYRRCRRGGRATLLRALRQGPGRAVRRA